MSYERGPKEYLKYIRDKLRFSLSDVGFKARDTEESNSQYLYITHKTKSACVRISDHFKYVHPKRVSYETRRKNTETFYQFTVNNIETIPGLICFDPSEVDDCIRAVLEYFDVPS